MKIHLVGIGGVAMGNLGAMLKNTGHQVTGSDVGLYPPMSLRLKDWGIQAREYSAKNVKGAELCIIGNALSRGNPEVEEILKLGLPYMSMSQALKEFFLKGKHVIVAAGTHGKTTTTFLADHLITRAHKPPGLFAGGVRGDGMDGFRVSDSPYFVIEGDEYDTAFFDKASKFLHYLPRSLILTSVEFDHADIFDNYKAYKLTFQRLLRLVPGNGLVAACGEGKGVREVMDGYDFSPLEWYDVESARELIGEGGLNMMGTHNLLNAAAALIVTRALGLPEQKLRDALLDFPGVLRRQQIRKDRPELPGPLTLIEDFAHHPTAVRETIMAVRKKYPGRAIHALFEPRSATSHRKVFQKTYVGALGRADHVYVCDVHNSKKVSKDQLLDVRLLVRELKEKKAGRKVKSKVLFGKDPQALLAGFKKGFRSSPGGDVILVMSNGSFGGIYPDLDKLVESI